jgi:hypothetical protein
VRPAYQIRDGVWELASSALAQLGSSAARTGARSVAARATHPTRGKAMTRFQLPILSLVSLLWAAAAAAQVPAATLVGPIPQNAAPGDPSRDYTFFTPVEDLSDFGYVQEEYFVEGTANRYTTPSLATGSVISSGHPYRTRIVVRRPSKRSKSNGVVLFEWQNVSAGYEIDAHWGPSWPHFVQNGYTWVGVSAQRVGVHGSTIPLLAGRGLRQWSPTRYGSLDVTAGGTVLDDSLSYDIFAQSAQAVLNPGGSADPLGGIPVKQAYAVGASQSAGRLTIYYNSIQPLHQLFDAFYLLVGGGPFRSDLDVKVVRYLSETDVLRAGPGIRQADSDRLRTYEVAGTGHSSLISDLYRTPVVTRDFGEVVLPATCDLPPFSHVPGYYVINKQYDQLHRWARFGAAPPTAPQMEFDAASPPQLVRDELGIVVGGIRLPAVDAPIALNSGVNSGSSPFCVLYGTNQPFDDALLQQLYPTHQAYLEAVNQSAFAALLDGFINVSAYLEMVVEALFAEIPPQ